MLRLFRGALLFRRGMRSVGHDMNRDAGGFAMSVSQARIETMGDRYGCPGRTLDSWRERNRSSQRHFLGLVVLQTKAIAWTG